MFILFIASSLDDVYGELKKIDHIDVYKHNEIPSNLHYKTNSRIGDIVIFAHIGYSVYLNNQTDTYKTLSKTVNSLKEAHKIDCI